MSESPVTFKSKGKQIVGMLHLPSLQNHSDQVPLVVMLHGWAMGKSGNPQFTFVSTARHLCNTTGLGVLRFDFRGIGDSEGSFRDYNLVTMLEDLKSARRYISNLDRIDEKRIGLLGWSIGGVAAVVGGSRLDGVKSFVCWSVPADIKSLWPPSLLDELAENKELIVDPWIGLPTTLKILKTDCRFKTSRYIRNIRAPVLIVNGSMDRLVGVTQAKKLYKAARNPKRLHIIHGADHGFSHPHHKMQLLAETSAWFQKCLT